MQTHREAIDPNKSATALRALKVLEALAQSRDALSAAEVAGIIGAERTTAYRMLMTLMEAGYVVRDQRAHAYRLGYKVLTLSRALLSGNEKTELVAACLRAISAHTGEAAHYSVLERDCAVLVQRAMGTQLVTIDFQIGDRAPLHCTSIGKVLLAYQEFDRDRGGDRSGPAPVRAQHDYRPHAPARRAAQSANTALCVR